MARKKLTQEERVERDKKWKARLERNRRKAEKESQKKDELKAAIQDEMDSDYKSNPSEDSGDESMLLISHNEKVDEEDVTKKEKGEPQNYSPESTVGELQTPPKPDDRASQEKLIAALMNSNPRTTIAAQKKIDDDGIEHAERGK